MSMDADSLYLAKIKQHYAPAFQAMTGLPLENFYSAVGGFEYTRLCDVLNIDTEPAVFLNTVYKKWGSDGVVLISKLMKKGVSQKVGAE